MTMKTADMSCKLADNISHQDVMDWSSSSPNKRMKLKEEKGGKKILELRVHDSMVDLLACVRKNRNKNLILFPKGGYAIDTSDAESLAQALACNTTLQSLSFEEVHLSSVHGIHRFIGALMTHPTIQRLSLYDNRLGDDGILALMNAIVNPMNTSIAYGFHPSFHEYYNCHSLHTLCLCNNQIGDRGAYWISQAIHFKGTITELDLSSNEITDQGTIYLAEMLSRSNLTAFILNGNHAGIKGALAIARAARYNQKLEVLGICGNDIGDEGAIHLSHVAKTHLRLKALLLEDNFITEPGILAIADAHRHNPRLGMMEISWNFCSTGAMQFISASIQNVVYLYLDRCEVEDTHMEILAHALTSNKSIRDLFLEGNRIGLRGIQHLARALEANDSLQGLFLDGNHISRAGALLLSNVLKNSNTSLRRLQIHDDYHDVQREIDVYLDLNGAGRRFVLRSSFPKQLWTEFLVQKDLLSDPDLVYHLIRERPDLFSSPIAESS